MSFKIGKTNIDLSDTLIENIFINDYMPMADGTFVKVYLLGYKYATTSDTNLVASNDTIAKNLNILLSDVLRAWNFWEDKGVIRKHFIDESEHNYEVEFVNLKQLYINNILKPSESSKNDSFINHPSSTTEELVQAKNTPIINEMFKDIRAVMKRYITPNEYKRIYDWIDTYNVSPDIVVTAFKYSSERRNKRTLSFIEGVIRNWHDEGVTNADALEKYFETKDVLYYKYKRIMKSLGINDLPSDAQKKFMNKWFKDWDFDLEVILRACDEGVKIRKPTFPYIDGVLSNWHQDNVKTLEDVEERKEKFKSSNQQSSFKTQKNSKPKKVNTHFHNFEQTTSKYSDKELEEKLLKNFQKKH